MTINLTVKLNGNS